jgi:hypothetical protein
VEHNYPRLDETKTTKPLLFKYFLEFDKLVDYFSYKERFLVNCKYSLGEPMDSAHVNIYEDSLVEGNFEFESSQHNLFYNRVDDLCFVSKKQLDPKQEPFYTGSCFHFFYNHLSYHHVAVLQYADKLPVFAKKDITGKAG